MSWSDCSILGIAFFRAEVTIGGATVILQQDRGCAFWAKPPVSAPIVPPVEFGGPEQWRELGEWLLAKADEFEDKEV